MEVDAGRMMAEGRVLERARGLIMMAVMVVVMMMMMLEKAWSVLEGNGVLRWC